MALWYSSRSSSRPVSQARANSLYHMPRPRADSTSSKPDAQPRHPRQSREPFSLAFPSLGPHDRPKHARLAQTLSTLTREAAIHRQSRHAALCSPASPHCTPSSKLPKCRKTRVHPMQVCGRRRVLCRAVGNPPALPALEPRGPAGSRTPGAAQTRWGLARRGRWLSWRGGMAR